MLHSHAPDHRYLVFLRSGNSFKQEDPNDSFPTDLVGRACLQAKGRVKTTLYLSPSLLQNLTALTPFWSCLYARVTILSAVPSFISPITFHYIPSFGPRHLSLSCQFQPLLLSLLSLLHSPAPALTTPIHTLSPQLDAHTRQHDHTRRRTRP